MRRIVEFAGSQSVVASIDYKKDIFGKVSVITHDGTDKVGYKLEDAINHAVKYGVGEILLTSIDHEGKMNGYDLQRISSIGKVDVPIILNGGAGNLENIKDALDAGADAVAVSSFFMFYGKNRAVLINTPSEDEYYSNGIFKD